MKAQEYHKGRFRISTDKSLLDLDVIYSSLKSNYWADNVPQEVVRTAVENSLCFGMYDERKQIAFARIVTDFSTIAYIADFFLIEEFFEQELSDWMMQCICAHPQLHPLRRWLLASKDGLYAKFQFTPVLSSSA
ncbi:MAG: GNAT family N-acetyltransferase [bacterium]|nr:GNAT family N-acetyltransferase [bacterium]